MRDGTGLTPGREIMKRLFAIIAPLLILLGCDGKKGGPDPVDIEWGAGRQLAVAFLGYYDSEAAFRHSDYYAGLANCYPWLAEAAEAGTPDGMALCLVIPRYESSELTVSQYVPAGTKKEKGVKILKKRVLWGEKAKPSAREFITYLHNPDTMDYYLECIEPEWKSIPAFQEYKPIVYKDMVVKKDPVKHLAEKYHM